MPYNLVQAGAAVGKSKTAILRAIRRGAISAERDQVTGGWAIEPAELHRWLPLVALETSRTPKVTAETSEIRELRARLDAAEAAIRFRDETLTDLRRRFDIATQQLGDALQQVRVLTDQRTEAKAIRWWLPWRR